MRERAHLERREPAKGRRFAWGRVPRADGGAATWRLFRRCIPGGWVTEQRTFAADAGRAEIAAELRVMRARLLAAADEVDLAHLGLTTIQPAEVTAHGRC